MGLVRVLAAAMILAVLFSAQALAQPPSTLEPLTGERKAVAEMAAKIRAAVDDGTYSLAADPDAMRRKLCTDVNALISRRVAIRQGFEYGVAPNIELPNLDVVASISGACLGNQFILDVSDRVDFSKGDNGFCKSWRPLLNCDMRTLLSVLRPNLVTLKCVTLGEELNILDFDLNVLNFEAVTIKHLSFTALDSKLIVSIEDCDISEIQVLFSKLDALVVSQSRVSKIRIDSSDILQSLNLGKTVMVPQGGWDETQTETWPGLSIKRSRIGTVSAVKAHMPTLYITDSKITGAVNIDNMTMQKTANWPWGNPQHVPQIRMVRSTMGPVQAVGLIGGIVYIINGTIEDFDVEMATLEVLSLHSVRIAGSLDANTSGIGAIEFKNTEIGRDLVATALLSDRVAMENTLIRGNLHLDKAKLAVRASLPSCPNVAKAARENIETAPRGASASGSVLFLKHLRVEGALQVVETTIDGASMFEKVKAGTMRADSSCWLGQVDMPELHIEGTLVADSIQHGCPAASRPYRGCAARLGPKGRRICPTERCHLCGQSEPVPRQNRQLFLCQ